MAGTSETSALVENVENDSEPVYLNMGYGAVSERRSSVSSNSPESGPSLTVDEFIYRVRYAVLDKTYNVEADIRAVLQTCTEDDIVRLLQELNSLPLKIRQKQMICKLLHSEGYLKRRYRTGTTNKIEKKRGFQMLEILSIWEDTIARLTAYFGSNVASYFRFVRSIIYMNIFTALLLVGFITMPKVIDGSFKSNITFGGHFGELSDSIMFYGLYTDDLSFKYNLPTAYFLTWLAVNLMCFVYIITLMIVRYKKSKLLTDRGSEYRFAWRTFCTWDYSITSRQGVIDHRTSLRTDLKELVREEKAAFQVNVWTRLTWYVGRLISNVIVIGILVGSGFLIYTVADRDILPDTASESLKEFFRKYQLTGVVAGLKFLVPPLFQQLVRLEGWHPRTETKFTLARTTVFYIASLLVFVLSLYKVTENEICNIDIRGTNKTDCCWENDVGEEVFKVILLDFGILIAVGIIVHMARGGVVKSCYTQTDCCWENDVGEEVFKVILLDFGILIAVGIIVHMVRGGVVKYCCTQTDCCWENDVGEEVFKVILLDFGILIAVGIIVHMARGGVVKYCCTQIGYSKFDVVACVLDVIYGQSLVWLGLYFSPLLGLVGFIKLVCVFYVRLIIARVAMVPPQQLFRASSTGNFYLAILLLNLFVCLFPMAYAVIQISPSTGCGPFIGEERSYRVISDMIGELPDWLENILVYISTPAIMVPLVILLILSTIYFNVKFSSYKSLTEELRKQLLFERRVEKRKIFATGRAMSAGGTLSRYTSQESLISNMTQQGGRYTQPPDNTITEEHDM